ncbi:hypothetical protein Tco_0349431 [Tanacetum coccineum]
MNLQVQRWFQMFLLKQTQEIRHYKIWNYYSVLCTKNIPLHSTLPDNSLQQDTQPTMNVQPTKEPIIPLTNDNAEENNNNQAADAQFEDYEFINPFAPSGRKLQDHPLEQVRRDPSKPVQTRRQLATDPEMCMFALTVSKSEPTNIKEAMADHAWIKAMQEELHQFDRLNVMEIVDNPFGKTVIDYVVV